MPGVRAFTQGIDASGSVTINKPAGTVQNDALVALIETSGATVVGSVPSGFVSAGASQAASNFTTLHVYVKAAGSSEPASYTFAANGASQIAVILLACDDVDPAAIVAAYATSGTTVDNFNIDAPAVAAANGTRALRFAGGASGNTGTNSTWASGATEAGDIPTTGLGSLTAAYDTALVSGGNTGTRRVTWDSFQASNQGAITLALTPAPVTAQNVTPGGIPSGEAFGSSSVGVGPVDLAPGGIPSAEAWQGQTVTTGAVTTSPAGIASAEAFGSSSVTASSELAPAGIASSEAFGTAAVIGDVALAPTGIATAEQFGFTTQVAPMAVLVEPAGIASAEAWQGQTVTVGAVSVSPAGIASGEAFGTATVTGIPPQDVTPAGIATGEAFGSSSVGVGPVDLTGAIPSSEAFGSTTIDAGAVTLSPAGIASAEAWGATLVEAGASSIVVGAIPSSEAWGATTVTAGATSVTPAGVPSSEAWGSSTVTGLAYVPELLNYPTSLTIDAVVTYLVIDPAPTALVIDGQALELTIDPADTALTIDEG